MRSTISFHLHNNYSQDVAVTVFDLFGGSQRQAWSGPLIKMKALTWMSSPTPMATERHPGLR
jgi:hypothetical protein